MIRKTITHTKKYIYEYAAYGIWAISWGGVFISLYYSEVQNLAPCELCWWQRIALYPVALIGTVAILRKKFRDLAFYALPFGILGMIVSFYHSLLQWGVIEEKVLDCSAAGAVSCSDPETIFWFVTIPFGSFVAFTGVVVLSLLSIYAPKFLLKDV